MVIVKYQFIQKNNTLEDNSKIILIQSLNKDYIFCEHWKEKIKFLIFQRVTDLSKNYTLNNDYAKNKYQKNFGKIY